MDLRLDPERRQVTVLFCDLVGYTAYSADNDPEEVRDLLLRYFDLTSAVVGRHGGIVEKYVGDAVMAVWGVPNAHEDDAARAVRAGLELLEAIPAYGASAGVELVARVGVASGEAATTETVEQGIVIGDRVNLAARVQTAAVPGTCYVDGATRRLAGDAIAFESAASHALKGIADQVELFRAVRAVTRVRRRAGGLEAPFFGRDSELELVKDLFHRTVERHTPHLAVVVGPAGVGKSRLGWEFERYLDGLAETVLWHRGHCLSYGDGVSFWALAEMVRQRLGIAEEDQPELAAAKLGEGVTRLVPEHERAYIGPRIARLLGTEEPESRDQRFAKEELFAGWRQFFEHLAGISPVVLLVEDAEHADAGLLEFLDHLVDWSVLPIFVLVLARPELKLAQPGFGTGRRRTVIALEPLDDSSIDRILESLVPGLPSGARQGIADRSEGIPLFALETVRSMIDFGVVAASDDGAYRLVGDATLSMVPESLVGLLGARLDTLKAATRRLVGTAAVLGTRFSADALVSVSRATPDDVQDALDELVARDVLKVTVDRLSPQRGDYRFTHELLRQVAYDRLARRERKARHVEVASHLRAVFANDAEEVADVVARHYLDALAALPRDSDVDSLRSDALAFLTRAARRAHRSGAPAKAAERYAEAAAIAAPAAAPALLELASAAADDAGEFEIGIADVDVALERYQQLGDSRGVARAQALRGRILQRVGRHAAARADLVQALDVLRPDPGEDTVGALHHLARLEIYSGNLGEGAALAREALGLGRRIGVSPDELARLLVTNGLAAAYGNDNSSALADYSTACRLAQEAGDLGTLGMAQLDLGVVLRRTEPRRAVAAVRSAIENARRAGQREILAYAVANLALTLIELGQWDDAEAVLKEAVEIEHLDHGFVLCFIGWLAALRGDEERARHALDPVPAWRASERVLVQASVRCLQALIAVCAGDNATALASAMAVLEERRTLGIGADPPRWAWPLAARAARALGEAGVIDELSSMLAPQHAGSLPPVLLAQRTLIVAMEAARCGAHDAASSMAGALSLFRRAENPYELAHALVDAAEVATLAGAPAGDLLSEAEAIAARLRCPPLAARARSVRLTAVPEPRRGSLGPSTGHDDVATMTNDSS